MNGAMTHTSGLYRTCRELFTEYPLAIWADSDAGTSRSMVLMMPGEASFFVLSLDFEKGEPVCSLGPWPAGDVEVISADDADAPDEAENVLTNGVPIPRDGSLFGWTRGDVVTALIVIYVEYAEESPEPSWTVMPLAGSPESQWPPFTYERLFGRWFWDYYWSGTIITLGGLVAETRATAFWVDTKAILGSDCCAVARDVISSEGRTLPRGRYVYFQALRAGKLVPPLNVLLANAGKVDLAPRFEWSVHGDS